MYFGSIRFYKHLILLTMAIVVAVSLGSALYLAQKNSELEVLLSTYGINYKGEAETDKESVIGMREHEKRFAYYVKSFEYQSLYPNLYVGRALYQEDLPKSVYLTFDDGPSRLTPQVLDILKEKGVKATFFIVYNDSAEAQDIYRRMVAEGHTIGVHSTTHEYNSIYRSTTAFLDDFLPTAMLIEEVTNHKPDIFRFPGGSINAYNKDIYQQIIAELSRRGYTYYDWNVYSGDSSLSITKEQVYSNIVGGVHEHNKSIVLMHDSGSKYQTLAALPDIIDTLKREGYNFYPLTNQVRPVIFDYTE